MDTTDSMLMTRAYGWAFVHSLRKLWCNLTITAASVLVALCIGSAEALELLAKRFDVPGRLWRVVDGLNDDLSRRWYLVVGIFITSWLISIIVYGLNRFDRFVAD